MQTKSAPTAPPAYRPQPTPKVLQAKTALPPQQKRVAPPAYRPQPVPKVLQRQEARPPAAPPVHRPQTVPKVLQAKTAHAPSPAPLLAPFRQVIQREVVHDGTVYKGTPKRPGWRAHSEKVQVELLNKQEGTNYALNSKPFAKHKKDRGHIASFKKIQEWIVDYLNGDSSYLVLQTDVKLLIAQCGTTEQSNALSELKSLKTLVESTTPNVDSIVSQANELLALLNSVSKNLRPVNKYANEYVSDNLDPEFVSTPNRTRIRATEHSKSMAKMGEDKVGKVLLTPTKKSRVVSSDGPAPFGNMTPDTKSIFSSYPYETRNAKSENVKKHLKTNPYISTTPSTTPKVKINLNPTSQSGGSTSNTQQTTQSNNNNTPQVTFQQQPQSYYSPPQTTYSQPQPTQYYTSSYQQNYQQQTQPTYQQTQYNYNYTPTYTQTQPTYQQSQPSQQQLLYQQYYQQQLYQQQQRQLLRQQLEQQLYALYGQYQQIQSSGFQPPPQLVQKILDLQNQLSNV